jgi:hypothetical protein
MPVGVRSGQVEAMKIGPWVARKRTARVFHVWEARFTVAAANRDCNARMISRSQHITD